MGMSNYRNGFTGGVSVRGLPLLNTYTNNLIWVASNGSSNGDGSFQRPYANLQLALNAADSNKGDVIMAKAGHAETVSAATTLLLNKAGVSIVGLGNGLNRPTITFDTAATASIPVSAANMSIENFVFTANFADIVAPFTLAACKDFSVQGCLFKETAVNMNFLSLVQTGTVDNANDGFVFCGNTWFEVDAATVAMLQIKATADRCILSDNLVNNGAATVDIAAFITFAAGKYLTNSAIQRNNVSIVGNSSSAVGLFMTSSVTTHTGLCTDNFLSHTDATTELFQTANMGFGLNNNKATGVKATQGYLLPAADA